MLHNKNDRRLKLIDRKVLLIIVGKKEVFLDFLLFLQPGSGTSVYMIPFGPHSGYMIAIVKLTLLSSCYSQGDLRFGIWRLLCQDHKAWEW